ncbi:MAG: hypothetical protein K2W95_03530 [Candidatus Obscuribacterales bacterium]|nr:hypothetical protein [Candidatus Obscuribacterales bacterium]
MKKRVEEVTRIYSAGMQAQVRLSIASTIEVSREHEELPIRRGSVKKVSEVPRLQLDRS